MAKPLRKPQPSSSVDRFFNKASLDAALENHEEEETVPSLSELPKLMEDAPRVEQKKPAATATELNASPRPRNQQNVVSMRPQQVEPDQASGELVDRARDFRLTRTADESLSELTQIFRRATETTISRSHVLRALLSAVSECLPDVRREAEKLGTIKRPSNNRGYEADREIFEQAVSGAIRRAMKG